MTANSSARKQDVMSGKPVELGAFVQALLQAGRIAEADAQALLARRRDREDLRKPLLAWLAEQNLVDQAPPHRVLDIETLTRFLADQAGQDYYRIDPLKIDVAQVTQVMSYAFTQRHNILAVEVRPLEVLIASTEPFISSWEADLEHVLQKRIRRVVANPWRSNA